MILKSSEREIPMFMYTHFYISLTRPKFFAFKKPTTIRRQENDDNFLLLFILSTPT